MIGDSPRPAGITEQCTATSKRTKRRCGQLVPGGGVCRWHGRNAAAERQRQIRVEIAQAKDLFADRFEAREWYEALPAAAALADQLMQALRDKVELAGTLTMTEIDALAQLTERVARLQKLAQDSNLDERRVRITERQVSLFAEGIRGILGDLGHDPADPHVVRVVSDRLLALADGAAS